jgi:hypothetical protein
MSYASLYVDRNEPEIMQTARGIMLGPLYFVLVCRHSQVVVLVLHTFPQRSVRSAPQSRLTTAQDCHGAFNSRRR